MSLPEYQQDATLGPIVTLYAIDPTSIDNTASILRFTPMARSSTPISFDGDTYPPVPVEDDGFEISGTGALPRPTFRVANVNRALTSELIALDDLVGALVTRIRTLERFTDNGAEPDGDAYLSLEKFRIFRKSRQDKVAVEWELRTDIDYQGQKLPRRLALRDACTQIYRRYDSATGTFDYTKATCPWAGSDDEEGGTEGPFFDAQDNEVASAADDVCGKRLTSCKARHDSFGLDLPFWGFPGLGRVR